ncbi:MAG TPA: hypothetical protein VN749_09720 [Candidatus Eisenbacteria bacterium]|jgi:type IV secretory pathway protease TraF|nr:hypothetical protein [Candidatus Eisenbacteria bacterium]
MKLLRQPVLVRAALLAAVAACSAAYAKAQVPAPVVGAAVDTAVPIVVGIIRPHKVSQPKFEGTVVNATVAQITVRAKGNDMAIQTFTLSEAASAQMLAIIDKGGYQYGDKVTVFYDPDSKKALKVKGKPSKAS